MSNKDSKVERDVLESTQTEAERQLAERIARFKSLITEADLDPQGRLRVPEDFKRPGFHYHFMAEHKLRQQELEKLGYEVAKNALGEIHRVEGSPSLILVEVPQELHEHVQRLKNVKKVKRYNDLISSGPESPDLYRLPDSKFNRVMTDITKQS